MMVQKSAIFCFYFDWLTRNDNYVIIGLDFKTINWS